MDERKSELVAKVPQGTLLFWIIKILATTLGESQKLDQQKTPRSVFAFGHSSDRRCSSYL